MTGADVTEDAAATESEAKPEAIAAGVADTDSCGGLVRG